MESNKKKITKLSRSWLTSCDFSKGLTTQEQTFHMGSVSTRHDFLSQPVHCRSPWTKLLRAVAVKHGINVFHAALKKTVLTNSHAN